MGEKQKRDKLEIRHIGKTAFKKFIFPKELLAGQQADLRQSVTELLQEDGRFYACYLNKELIGYVVIEKIREELENDWAYRLKEFYLASGREEYRAEIKAFVMAELKEVSEWYDCHIIIWEEEVIRRKKIKIGSTVWVLGPLMGSCVGMLFGLILDNVGVGVAIGFAIGYALSAGWTAAEHSADDKNATDSENATDKADNTGGGACR